MAHRIVLASGSAIRATLLGNAGVDFDVTIARIDEQAVKDSLVGEGASPREVADALAEGKARKIGLKEPEALVIGCDQVLGFRGQLFSKPRSPEEARAQLGQLNGERHMLLSAAVIYHEGKPVWRHVGEVRLTMKTNSDAYLDAYVSRNWHSIRDAVGAYKLEEEGVRLFSRIDGEYFNVLGLPLLELLAYLAQRGAIAA
ncbi:Maf-like protein YceF [Aquimixticola soesokkakensis]|uniref:Nucleoside triphosphate pyrophosphatase n=1 Tax=Aquimixticola soesokkakensis TaxID=1519096 RepID=A0A1Y5R9U6_9RHOB|nr:Maf family nucleotide pyrophosphatase [Aquimixticola soesokkakensis]SLN11744.1 Maf-like protein YceF [Aquimixticola soesokkakensis]